MLFWFCCAPFFILLRKGATNRTDSMAHVCVFVCACLFAHGQNVVPSRFSEPERSVARRGGLGEQSLKPFYSQYLGVNISFFGPRQGRAGGQKGQLMIKRPLDECKNLGRHLKCAVGPLQHHPHHGAHKGSDCDGLLPILVCQAEVVLLGTPLFLVLPPPPLLPPPPCRTSHSSFLLLARSMRGTTKL